MSDSEMKLLMTAVTTAITSSVIACTLLLIIWETIGVIGSGVRSWLDRRCNARETDDEYRQRLIRGICRVLPSDPQPVPPSPDNQGDAQARTPAK